jgi:4-carboxymuconolactone decarboxylase
MRVRYLLPLLASLPVVAHAQQALPPEINPTTLSRLAPITLQDLDEAGQKRLADRLPNFKAGPGPTHVTIFAPPSAELGIPTGEKSPVGARNFQLAVLIIAREIDQQFEWTMHEPYALRQGLEQNVIDVVKFNKDVKGLSEKDATFITFGRTLYREHHVSNELWNKMLAVWGKQRTIELMSIMGEYFKVGFMLNAVDQRVPAPQEPLLPAVKH